MCSVKPIWSGRDQQVWSSCSTEHTTSAVSCSSMSKPASHSRNASGVSRVTTPADRPHTHKGVTGRAGWQAVRPTDSLRAVVDRIY